MLNKITKPYDESTGNLELNIENDYEKIKKENEKLLRHLQSLKDTNSIAESNLAVLADQVSVLRSSNSLLTKTIKDQERILQIHHSQQIQPHSSMI